MSLLGVFVTTAFVASPVLRDRETGTHELFFSTPIRKRDYLVGRFAGALAVALAVFVPVVLGVLLGSLMPWLDPERVGPFRAGPYLQGLLDLRRAERAVHGERPVRVGHRSRGASWRPTPAWSACSSPTASPATCCPTSRTRPWPPCSIRSEAGRSASPRATGPSPSATRCCSRVDGALLANRLVVLGLAALVFAVAYRRFSFTVVERRPGRRWRWRRERRPADSGAPSGDDAVAPSAWRAGRAGDALPFPCTARSPPGA